MNKTLALVLVAALLAVAPVLADMNGITVVSGTVTDMSDNPVQGADVEVTCNGYTEMATTQADGVYYVTYDESECGVGDSVEVEVTYEDMTGSGSGTVEGEKCVVDAAIVDIQIPEFGVVAGAVALIGGVAGFLVLRRKN